MKTGWAPKTRNLIRSNKYGNIVPFYDWKTGYYGETSMNTGYFFYLNCDIFKILVDIFGCRNGIPGYLIVSVLR
jgi:hypothetical protein